jgi:hypothetical protein
VSPRLLAFLPLCAALALGLPARAQGPVETTSDGPGIELLGDWHLTIHYRDEASGNPDARRWDDRLWRFEPRGTRMQWTEFPIVLFEDQQGRFETTEGERTVRTLDFWEPNAAQLAQITRGLLVNPRGAKSKGMRGSVRRGYGSVGGLRSESVSVIGYSESWSVRGLPSQPVFTQDVVMGSGRTEDMEGRTRYTAESVSDDGREVRGRFGRDGTRHGTFVLRRAGDPVVMGGKKASKKGGKMERPGAP